MQRARYIGVDQLKRGSIVVIDPTTQTPLVTIGPGDEPEDVKVVALSEKVGFDRVLVAGRSAL